MDNNNEIKIDKKRYEELSKLYGADEALRILNIKVKHLRTKKSKKPRGKNARRIKKAKHLKKKIKQERKNKQYESISAFAEKINQRLPKSEIWFQKIYKKYQYKDDKFNVVFQNKFIPDVVNFQYRYVIEIDGSIHLTEKQIHKDKQKDIFYKRKKFTVFRIIAYDMTSFRTVMAQLMELRLTSNNEREHSAR